MIDLPEPVRFYLRHQAQIEEWAALAQHVHGLAHGFYCGLRPRLEAAAAEMDGCPELEADLDGRDCKYVFLLPAWRDAEGVRRAGIGLEWRQGSCTFTNALSGVYIRAKGPGSGDLHDAVRQRLTGSLAAHGLKARATWWAAWRSERPSRSDYWDDLDGFATQLLETLTAWWTLFREPISEAVLEVSAGDQPPP